MYAPVSLHTDWSGKAETLQQRCASYGMFDAWYGRPSHFRTKYAGRAERAKGCDRRPSTEPLPSVRRLGRDMAPLTMMRHDGEFEAEAVGG
jgi:hypothetical protein